LELFRVQFATDRHTGIPSFSSAAFRLRKLPRRRSGFRPTISSAFSASRNSTSLFVLPSIERTNNGLNSGRIPIEHRFPRRVFIDLFHSQNLVSTSSRRCCDHDPHFKRLQDIS